VRPRDGLDREDRGKILLPLPGIEPRYIDTYIPVTVQNIHVKWFPCQYVMVCPSLQMDDTASRYERWLLTFEYGEPTRCSSILGFEREGSKPSSCTPCAIKIKRSKYFKFHSGGDVDMT
jgi:hypothetical protein